MGCLSVKIMVYLFENTIWPDKSVLAITWPSNYIVKIRYIFLMCLLYMFCVCLAISSCVAEPDSWDKMMVTVEVACCITVMQLAFFFPPLFHHADSPLFFCQL